MAHHVVLIAYEGLSLFEFGVATEIFGLERPEIANWYTFSTASEEGRAHRATGGVIITSHGGLRQLYRADTIIVPGWGPDMPLGASLKRALLAAHVRGARLVSFCSGAFALAATGLLDGKQATTHWRYAEYLAERYPKIEVDASVLYADQGRICTSAGSAAAIDLSLHLVRRDHGPQIANLVARRLVMPPHRDGGQAQFITSSIEKNEEESPVSRAMNWARAHLEGSISVARLSRVAKMSERSFARHFRDQVGTTPADWITRERILVAQGLLETSPLSVDEIAQKCGFGSTPTLRHHFARKVGVPPTRYRAEFRDR